MFSMGRFLRRKIGSSLAWPKGARVLIDERRLRSRSEK